MRPTQWVVQWSALRDVAAGSLTYSKRHEARGFYLMRKAAGFDVTITPAGFV